MADYKAPKNVPVTLLTGDQETDDRISANLAAQGLTREPKDVLLDAARKGAEFIASQFAPDANTVGAAGVAKLRSLLPGGAPYEEELARYNAAAPDPTPEEFAMRFVAPAGVKKGGVKGPKQPLHPNALRADELSLLTSLAEREQKWPGYLDKTGMRSHMEALEARKAQFGADTSVADLHARIAKEAEREARENEKWLYHVTSEDRLPQIMEQGLRPDAGALIGRQPGYDAHSRGRVFFTDGNGRSFWEERANLHLADQMDTPPRTVVLRVPRKSVRVEVDEIGNRDHPAGEAFYTTEAVPPEMIKVVKGPKVTARPKGGSGGAEATSAPAPAAVKTDSPAFKEWFGKSTVVDEQGAPLRVLHGTPAAGFESFSPEARGGNTGSPDAAHAFFFTNSPRTSDTYSRAFEWETGRKAEKVLGHWPKAIGQPQSGTYPVHLKIENPLVITEPTRWITPEIIADARKAGHDGIIRHLDPLFPGEREYAVFEPTQIKSAMTNVGTFDPKDPRINYAHGGEVGGEMAPVRMASGGAVSPVTLAIEEEQRRRALAEQMAAQAALSRGAEQGPPPVLTGDPSVDALIGGGVPSGAAVPPVGPGLSGDPWIDQNLSAQSAAAPPLGSTEADAFNAIMASRTAGLQVPPGLQGMGGDFSASLAANPELGADANGGAGVAPPAPPAPAPQPPPQSAPSAAAQPVGLPTGLPSGLGPMPSAPAPGGGPSLPGVPVGAIRAASAERAAGINAEADATARAEAEKARLLQGKIQAAQDFEAKVRENYANFSREAAAIRKDIDATHIDPKKFWASRTQGQKVTAVIGLFLGGFGQGMVGGDNPALTILRKAIDDDLDAQKAELGKKWTLLGALREQYQDGQAAESMFRVAKLAGIEAEIERVAAQSGSEVTRARARQAIAQIKGDQEVQIATLSQQRAVAQVQIEHARAATVAAQMEAETKRYSLEEARRQQAVRAQVLSNPGAYPEAVRLRAAGHPEELIIERPGDRAFLAKNKEGAGEVRQTLKGVDAARAGIGHLLGLQKKPGSAWTIEDRASAQVSVAALIGLLRLPITGPGAMNEGERKMLEEIAANPTRIFSISDANKAKLMTLRKVLENTEAATLSNYTVGGGSIVALGGR